MSEHGRLALALFLLFQGLFGLTASGRVDRMADEFEVYLQAESLVDRGSQAIPQCPEPVFFGTVGLDGQQYAPYGPATAFLVLPHHMLGRGVAAAAGIERADPAWTPVVAAVTSLATSTWSALAVVALFLAALSLGATRIRAALVAVVLGAGTLLWTYATLFYSEPISAALLIGAVALHLRDRPLLAAVAAFALFMIKASNIIFIPVLLVLVVVDAWKGDRKVFAGAAPILFAAYVAGLLHADWNAQRFGDAFEFGHSWAGVLRPGETHRPLLISEAPRALFGLLLTPGKSLFLYAPALLLVGRGLKALRTRRPALAAAWLTAFVVPLLFFSCYSYWEGGYSYGPRHLVPVVPLLLLPLAVGDLPKAWALKLAFAVGLVINVLGVSVSYMEDQAPGGRQDPGFVEPYYWTDPGVPYGRVMNRYRLDYVPFLRYGERIVHHVGSPPPGSGRTGLEFLPLNLLRTRARLAEADSPSELGVGLPWLILLPFPFLGLLGAWGLRRAVIAASLDAAPPAAETRPPDQESP